MARICLPKELAQRFRTSLKNGEIDVEKISQLPSKDRREYFSKIVGEEDAKMVNSLFESKLLLKNQKEGLIRWAKQVGGITEYKRADLLAKINKIENVLDGDTFYDDLASEKLGVNITEQEAKDITSLAREATEAQEKMLNAPRRSMDGAPTKEEIEFGLKTIRLNNYVNDLKVKAERISAKEFLFSPKKATMEVAGITKSLTSSLDNSALLRQGIKTIFSNPKQWIKNAPKTFSDIKKVFQNKEAKDLLNAEIISDPMYETMKRAKVAVGSIEEAFPTRAPEEIPLFGKLFKASEAAYSGFLHRMRVDLFKKYYKLAAESGINVNSKKELEGIGSLVNSLTGRGKLPGSAESAANLLNVTLFSPRNLQSHIDFLTGFAGRNVSPFAKKQMAISLIKTIAGIGSVMATAGLLFGDKAVELDPRSSDFGKIKIGKTRYDISGGMSSVITLLARQITGETKSKDVIKSITTGKYGSANRWSVLLDFFENKLSPLAQVGQDALEGKNFEGKPPTIESSLLNLIGPLSIQNIYESKDQMSEAQLLITAILEALGVGSSTY